MALAALLGALAGCGDNALPTDPASAEVGLQVWFHSGQPGERQTIRGQVARFNAGQEDIRVNLTLIPERSYNTQVQAAALAGDLPDLLEFDGPFVYNYVWQGHLVPLDGLISAETRRDLLPSVIDQGTFSGRLYSVGTFDSGLGLYARRSRLASAGIRIPRSADEAWSADEFDQALATLAASDEDKAVLDLKLNYPGEWLTYAFSPLIQSAGGDLIDRRTYGSARQVLDGPAAQAAMDRVQGWVQGGYVDPNLDDAAFTEGRVALAWGGHWNYAGYASAFGDDLVVMPLPDFGQGTRTGQGSWSWGITAGSEHAEAAAEFLAFLLRPEEVLAMAQANGAVPGTRTAVAQSPLYSAQGALRLFAEQLTSGQGVPRPQTPAYPVITSAFQEAFRAIRNGKDVQTALEKAATVIDQDIADNQGYPPVRPPP